MDDRIPDEDAARSAALAANDLEEAPDLGFDEHVPVDGLAIGTSRLTGSPPRFGFETCVFPIGQTWENLCALSLRGATRLQTSACRADYPESFMLLSPRSRSSRFLPAAAALAATFALAPIAFAQDIAISTTSPAQIGGVPFENDALVGYDPATDVGLLNFDLEDATGITRNLKSAHRYAGGDVLFSTQAGGSVDGIDFSTDDLVLYDASTGNSSLLFDGSALGLERVGSGSVFIDAVYVRDNGNIVFSTLTDSTFLGITFDNDDLVEYDPSGPGSASVLFDAGSVITGSEGDPDIEGFHIQDDGRYAIAVRDGGGDATLTIAGLTFSRDDVVLFDPNNGTASLYLDGLASFANPGEAIDAVTRGIVPEPGAALLIGFGLAVLSRRHGRPSPARSDRDGSRPV